MQEFDEDQMYQNLFSSIKYLRKFLDSFSLYSFVCFFLKRASRYKLIIFGISNIVNKYRQNLGQKYFIFVQLIKNLLNLLKVLKILIFKVLFLFLFFLIWEILDWIYFKIDQIRYTPQIIRGQVTKIIQIQTFRGSRTNFPPLLEKVILLSSCISNLDDRVAIIINYLVPVAFNYKGRVGRLLSFIMGIDQRRFIGYSGSIPSFSHTRVPPIQEEGNIFSKYSIITHDTSYLEVSNQPKNSQISSAKAGFF